MCNNTLTCINEAPAASMLIQWNCVRYVSCTLLLHLLRFGAAKGLPTRAAASAGDLPVCRSARVVCMEARAGLVVAGLELRVHSRSAIRFFRQILESTETRIHSRRQNQNPPPPSSRDELEASCTHVTQDSVRLASVFVSSLRRCSASSRAGFVFDLARTESISGRFQH